MARLPASALTRVLELRSLLVLFGLGALGWAFLAIAEEVMEGETRAIDTALLLAMRVPGDPGDPVGPAWAEGVARDVTALGSNTVLAIVTLAVVGLLWLQRKGRTALFLILATAGGAALSHLMKLGIDRPRPGLVPHAVETVTASFPSGHAMMSAVAYLTLAALLARVQPLRRLKAYIMSLAILLTLAIGATRVYLGVHWPTDVLAGWTAGAAWALLCWRIASLLGANGDLAPAPPERS